MLRYTEMWVVANVRQELLKCKAAVGALRALKNPLVVWWVGFEWETRSHDQAAAHVLYRRNSGAAMATRILVSWDLDLRVATKAVKVRFQ